MLKVYFEDFQV